MKFIRVNIDKTNESMPIKQMSYIPVTAKDLPVTLIDINGEPFRLTVAEPVVASKPVEVNDIEPIPFPEEQENLIDDVLKDNPLPSPEELVKPEQAPVDAIATMEVPTPEPTVRKQDPVYPINKKPAKKATKK